MSDAQDLMNQTEALIEQYRENSEMSDEEIASIIYITIQDVIDIVPGAGDDTDR